LENFRWGDGELTLASSWRSEGSTSILILCPCTLSIPCLGESPSTGPAAHPGQPCVEGGCRQMRTSTSIHRFHFHDGPRAKSHAQEPNLVKSRTRTGLTTIRRSCQQTVQASDRDTSALDPALLPLTAPPRRACPDRTSPAAPLYPQTGRARSNRSNT
jgi:hypothetical protein